jgi:hypothetical protein
VGSRGGGVGMYIHGEVAVRSTHHYTAKSPFAAPYTYFLLFIIQV